MARAVPVTRYGGREQGILHVIALVVAAFGFIGIVVLISMGHWLGPIWNFTLLPCLITSLAQSTIVSKSICHATEELHAGARVASAAFAIAGVVCMISVNLSAERMALHSCALRVRCQTVERGGFGCQSERSDFFHCIGPIASPNGDRRLAVAGDDEVAEGLSDASLYYWVHDDCKDEGGGGSDRVCYAFATKADCAKHRFVQGDGGDVRTDDDGGDCGAGESPRELALAMARTTLVLLVPISCALALAASRRPQPLYPRVAPAAAVVVVVAEAEAIPVAVELAAADAASPRGAPLAAAAYYADHPP